MKTKLLIMETARILKRTQSRRQEASALQLSQSPSLGTPSRDKTHAHISRVRG